MMLTLYQMGRKNIIIAKMGRKKSAEGLNLLWSSLSESIQAENGNRVEIVWWLWYIVRKVNRNLEG